jgi:hypothetical protein
MRPAIVVVQYATGVGTQKRECSDRARPRVHCRVAHLCVTCAFVACSGAPAWLRGRAHSSSYLGNHHSRTVAMHESA